MNFIPAPRRPRHHRIPCPNGSPVSMFHEILKNRCFMKNRSATITPSPAIQLLHFIGLWHHRNVFELQQILVTQTNVHVSGSPTMCDQKLPMPWRAFVRKISVVSVLLSKPALDEPLIYEVARHRRAMKFAPAKKNH